MPAMSPKDAGLRLQKIQFRFLGMDEFSGKCISVRQSKTEFADWEKMMSDRLGQTIGLIDIISIFFDDEELLKSVFLIADPYLLFVYQNQISRSVEYLFNLKSNITFDVPATDSLFFVEFALINVRGIQ